MNEKIEIKYEKKKKKVSLKIMLKRLKILRAIRKIPIITHYVMIKQLLHDGVLDEHLKIMDKKKINTHNSQVLKKDYLTSEEHFIYLLDIFISYFLERINNIELVKTVLSECIKNDVNKELLSKNYYFTNEYLDKYIYNFNLMIIKNFYENSLSFKEELRNEYKIIEYNPQKMNINDPKDVEKLIELLSEMVFINKSRYMILSLFSKVNDITYKAYLSKWEIIFSNYINNIEFIKEYQKFKYK